MVSIVVPVYNVEQYLDQCVASIVNQTLCDIEIILVDDGSTDSCGLRCDAWAEKDSRITVYHKPNGGLMSAWKYGVSRASGEYIGFVDSDDWVDADMYEKMLAPATETGAQIVCAAFVSEYEDGRQAFGKNHLEPGFYDRERILREIGPCLLASRKYHDRGIYPSRWTKVFKRDMLMSVLEDCDERLSIGEDLAVLFACVQLADSMVIIDGFCPYHYRIISTSMIRAFSATRYEKIDLLKQSLLAINDKYATYDYRPQIYTDYLGLYFRTMEFQIQSSSGRELIKSLRESFYSDRIQEAIGKSDEAMLSKKHRMYLHLMKLGLVRAVVLLRRLKSRIPS